MRALGSELFPGRFWIGWMLFHLPDALKDVMSFKTVDGKREPWADDDLDQFLAQLRTLPWPGHGGAAGGGGGGGGGGGRGGGGCGRRADSSSEPAAKKAKRDDIKPVKYPDGTHPAAKLPVHKRGNKYDKATGYVNLYSTLSEAERQRRWNNNECVVCGQVGHTWRNCSKLEDECKAGKC